MKVHILYCAVLLQGIKYIRIKKQYNLQSKSYGRLEEIILQTFNMFKMTLFIPY